MTAKEVEELIGMVGALWGRKPWGTPHSWLSVLGGTELGVVVEAANEIYRRAPQYPPGAGQLRDEAERLKKNAEVRRNPPAPLEPEQTIPDRPAGDPFQRLAERWERRPPRGGDETRAALTLLHDMVGAGPGHRDKILS